MRVGVPPGIGDVYWALTKLRALRERWGTERVDLYCQRLGPERALGWAEMVDFVDSAQTMDFRSPQAEAGGIGYDVEGLDVVLWPNAVVDAGKHVRGWLPGVEFDPDFEVAVRPSPFVADVLVYASSDHINRSWFPGLGAEFWSDLMQCIRREFGCAPYLVGAGWDYGMAEQVEGACDVVGETTLAQVAGMIRDARVVVGVISGMTILANHFETPCAALAPDKFAPGFEDAWLRSDRVPAVTIRHAQIGPRGAAAVAESAAALAGL